MRCAVKSRSWENVLWGALRGLRILWKFSIRVIYYQCLLLWSLGLGGAGVGIACRSQNVRKRADGSIKAGKTHTAKSAQQSPGLSPGNSREWLRLRGNRDVGLGWLSVAFIHDSPIIERLIQNLSLCRNWWRVQPHINKALHFRVHRKCMSQTGTENLEQTKQPLPTHSRNLRKRGRKAKTPYAIITQARRDHPYRVHSQPPRASPAPSRGQRWRSDAQRYIYIIIYMYMYICICIYIYMLPPPHVPTLCA